ncbi:Hsp20/alpha crystallin family protein [Patescibacteria group bacterium]|nr:Hsp20/alpha crystallin family protein [Patescibacteria group bacterium]
MSIWDDLMSWSEYNDSHYLPVAADVYETAETVCVELAVPGVKPDGISINIVGDVLTVTGKSEKEEVEEKREYYQKQVRYGSFTQSITLPCAVKSEEAEATFTHGILKISLPKAEASKPKQIQIKVGDQK